MTPTKATAKTQADRAVMVTTVHKGVFFGYYDHEHGDTVTLTNARNCTYWSKAMKGFMGLAAYGPDKECKIGPKVPTLQLRNITAIIDVTAAAMKAWESAPWAK